MKTLSCPKHIIFCSRYFWFKYNYKDRSTTHPKFDPTGVRTHDLQIMTVQFMSLRCISCRGSMRWDICLALLQITSNGNRTHVPRTKAVDTWHNLYLLSLHDADTQREGEQQLVLLKQWATHITINAVGEVIVQVLYTIVQVIWWIRVDDRLKWVTFRIKN